MSNNIQAKITLSAVVAGLAILSCVPVHAQSATTLRDPLIPGALYTPPNTPAPVFLPPPPGCGSTPWPVTPGMGGGPSPEPSVIPVPPLPVNNPAAATAACGGALQPPNSTQGGDPGELAPNNSGYQPPATQVDISSGQMPGNQAPTNKWGGQTSTDFGRNTKGGSTVFDSAMLLPQKNGVAQQPQYSQDGPHNGANGQVTHDLGVPFLVHQQTPVQIVAPY